MKVMEDRRIGSLWKENWLMGDESRVIKELIRKLVEERTFQVGFEGALQAFGISKEDYESSKLDGNLDASSGKKRLFSKATEQG